jgi:AraC family transcriptional regulator of adaptative response/methylated-DNA-[protein]-cysteine methyltransferase
MHEHSEDLARLRRWLVEADYTQILELARVKKSLLSRLTALTYDPEPVVSDRSVVCTGLVAKIIYESDPEYVRNYLLRLFWLVDEESGGVCWRAPEMIGEILNNCPGLAHFRPLVRSLLEPQT